MPAAAREIESQGVDGAYTFEGPHDPFFPLALAAEHTERIDLMTAVAIAFARNPMHLAYIGRDLQEVSAGRAVLGLGSQIRAHIEKRFSMPWSHPAARMREFVLAMRAIWSTWQDGTPLRFEGDFYRHTLMTPFFSPGPSAHGPVRVFLAGVGPKMTEVAGEVADGLLVHPFGSARTLRELTIPALERGLARSGRAREDVEVAWPVMLVTGTDDAQMRAAEGIARAQLAFYGSTPAYRVILDLHGWGDLQPELRRLSKEGRWDAMAALIPDEMLTEFTLRGAPDEIGRVAHARYGTDVDRLGVNAPGGLSSSVWSALIDSVRGP